MKCPYCDNQKTRVIDSRAADEGGAIRRRRHCPECGGRFTTFERRERARMVVVKRDDTKEPYDREKLASGLYKACSKREVPKEVIESAVDAMEEVILTRQDKEVPAADIGEMVMERLRQIDEVAYLRFASVYKKFDDLQEFQQELGELMTEEVNRPA